MIEFRIKNSELRIKVLWLGLFMALFLILYSLFSHRSAYAQQVCLRQSPNPRVTNGLISTAGFLDSGNNFGNDSGVCIVDLYKAPFVPYKIPGYDDLKSIYYDQAKPPVRKGDVGGSPTQGGFTSVFTQSDVVWVKGNLSVDYTGTVKPSVIFVEGTLLISKNITYGDNTSGIVFVVKGDVNIDQAVTRIDAVIIAQGTICTAFSETCLDGTVATLQLIINGSLVSIGSASIQFSRTLNDNSSPAEKIIQQPKYLVILKDLMSDTLQKWSEIP